MMASTNPFKGSKWFSHKSLAKSLHRLRRPKKSAAATEIDGFRELFCRLDSDGDGRISSEELRSFMEWAGDQVSPAEAAAVVRDLDDDGDGLIDYGGFARLVGDGGGRGKGTGEYEEDLRLAFEMFQVEEGAGCITPHGLKSVLGRLGEERTEEQCAAMIRAYDLDGNGVLDYHEFHRMMG
ncbi:hypothetical protein HPP92_003538 [Vanilla planifolia]|uniref:EF-hand domain-containing protein n=1 Tax=Vanilla planifolia TaxID=51239 RepID=A0A835VHA9_VANPL|nr:hypothetical protein HPP92_003538 [Vanilla planifolia]